MNGVDYVSKRFLKTDYSNTVIRDIRQDSILKKINVLKESKFNEIVSLRNPYGISADFFNDEKKYKEYNASEVEMDNTYKIYGVKGIKGGAKRTIAYIPIDKVTKNLIGVNSYKIFFSKAYMTTAINYPEVIISKPKELCTETFLQIGCFNNEFELKNCLSYMNTKFFKLLLFFNRSSLNISNETFSLIPLVSFDKAYTDDFLYEKYNFNAEEIEYINSLFDN